MKSAQELASMNLTSPAEQKRQALALRRIAGGINTAIARKESTGLSDKEVRTLVEASALLNALAANHAKAQKLVQSKRDARDAMERNVRVAMRDNFETLTSIADRVALIGAVSSYKLRDGHVLTLDDLDYHVKECIDSLCYGLATTVTSMDPIELVAEAWAKFEAAQAGLKEKHANDISRLMLARGETPARKRN